MKSLLTVVAAAMLMVACAPAEKGGCAECEKMAVEANAHHKAMKAKGGDCCCNK